MNLAQKILIYATALVTFATVIVSVIFYFSLTDVSKEKALSELEYINQTKKDDFIAILENLKSNVIALEQTPPIKPIARAYESKQKVDPITGESLQIWSDRLTQIFKGILKANPYYSQIRYISTRNNGLELIRVERMKNGKIIIQTKKQEKGSRGYFKKTLDTKPGHVYLSSIELNREYGQVVVPYQPVIRASIPIYIDNRIHGMIVINKDMDWFLKQFEKGFSKHASSYMFDNKKNFLSHPDPKLKFRLDLRNVSTEPVSDPPGWTLAKSLIQSNNKARQLSKTLGDHLLSLTIYQYNNDSPDSFLAFVTRTPTWRAYTIPSQVMIQALSAVLICLLLLLPFGFVLAKQFSLPLASFTENMRRYRETGEYTKPSHFKFNFKEARDMGESFADLTETIENQKKQIIDQQKQMAAQEKFTALGVLSAGIAHEINNPLAIIKSYVDSLRLASQSKALNNQHISNFTAKMDSAIDRIQSIIQGLKTFTKGDNDGELYPLKVSDLIRVTSQFVHAQSYRNITFTIDEINPSLQVKGITGPLSQVITNLLNNAFYAAQKSTDPWVKLEVEDSEKFVFIKVTDSGDISKEIIDQIMDPFFTTKPEGQGTGLGLSISRNIIDKHNGELFVDEQTSNTCFVVKLPKA